jgi:RNA polymerase sigma-70 factor (ECF subfamily)
MDLPARHGLLRAAVAHAPELARFFKGRVSNAEDAQDLMQELYVALLRIPGSQEVIRHPKAYLIAIAGNLVHQHWQRTRIHPIHISLENIPAEVVNALPSTDANDPEAAAIFAERLLQVQQRLNDLSIRVQAAVLWHHRDGYTCDEVAEKLSIVTHRVKKYLVRGLSHCRGMPTSELT